MVAELLARNGITVRNMAPGNRKTLCPKCSHTRRNKRDPCLSVKIDDDEIVWCCHNCNWTGGDRSAEAQSHRGAGKARAGHRNADSAWRRKLQSSWR